MQLDSAVNRLELYLRERGLRVTEPRRAVLRMALSTSEHFSAEELHGWLLAGEVEVSRATVYRTLSVLVEGGFLVQLDSSRGKFLYEHTIGQAHHDHMVCLSCRQIGEFFSPDIERLQEEAAAARGFEIVHHSLVLEGYCSACRAQGLNH